MRIYQIILILIFQPVCIFGQIDFLMPCADFGRVIEPIKKYEQSLSNILLEDFNNQPVARFVVRPALDPEYCFQIDKLNENAYNLKVSYLRVNLWNSTNRDTIKAVLLERVINPEFALKVSLLFKKSLDSISYRPNILTGLDGIDYYFSQYNDNHGIICGETWSPNKGSKVFDLVSICDRIVDYVKTGKDDFDDILNKIEKLVKKLCQY